jgi:acetate kinase
MDTRAEVCSGLAGLGIVVDPERNNCRGAAVISAENSPVTVRVVPPAEDLVIVNHVVRLLGSETNSQVDIEEPASASV